MKNEVEKLPRQQRKGNLKVKMDDFTQKKQTMVRLREHPPVPRLGNVEQNKASLLLQGLAGSETPAAASQAAAEGELMVALLVC